MKKYLLFVLALLLSVGVANAAGIPLATSPSTGPEVWTQEVFNDAGSALTSGSVVVWDYTDTDMSDLDLRKMYVTTTTTADDIATAGVMMDASCPDQSECTIAIYGPVAVKLSDATGSLITAGDLVGTDGTAGTIGDFGGGGADNASLGWAIDADTLADSPMGGKNIGLIFVKPSVQSDD